MKETVLDDKQVDRQEEIAESPLEVEPRKKKKNIIFFIIPVVIVLLIVGISVYNTMIRNKAKSAATKQEEVKEDVLPLDESVKVDLVNSKSKDNSVVISLSGLGSRFVSVGYELQYESGGVGKGVTSGSKPLDISDQDTFEREIYLGTCSKNVCKPDLGVSKVSVVLELIGTANTKYQFEKEYEL